MVDITGATAGAGLVAVVGSSCAAWLVRAALAFNGDATGTCICIS